MKEYLFEYVKKDGAQGKYDVLVLNETEDNFFGLSIKDLPIEDRAILKKAFEEFYGVVAKYKGNQRSFLKESIKKDTLTKVGANGSTN